MTLTSKGQTEKKNLERGQSALSKVQRIAGATDLGTDVPMPSTAYALQTYLTSKYLYNSLLLDDIRELRVTENEVCKLLFRIMLKIKDRAVPEKVMNRLTSLLHITPWFNRVERDAHSYAEKLQKIANEEWRSERENETKLRRHARRTMWLLERVTAPTGLRISKQEDKSKKK